MGKVLIRSTRVVLVVMFICSAGRMNAQAQAQTDAQTMRVGNAQNADTASPSVSTTKQGAAARTARQTSFAPLTADEKLRRAFKAAFFSPRPYAFAAVGAAITESREQHQPQKNNSDRFADGLSRFAINFATGSTSTLLGSGVYPAVFKQDPRYYPSHKQGFGARAAYAASRVFVTRGDDGGLEPNYSRFAGAFTASAMANVWEHSTPGHDRIGTDATLRRFGRSFISASISNIVLKEFGPDIIGIFRH
jgi:hypothetical protein